MLSDLTGSFALFSSVHTNPGGHREKLWQELFSDPSQWCDHRLEKVNE
jgi:hypothetical protein